MENFFQRVGSVKTGFDFELAVHGIDMQVPGLSIFKLIWEQKNKVSETREFTINKPENKALINENLYMANTIYRKGSEYLPKQSKIRLKQKTHQGWISIGSFTLDLSQYVHKPLIENVFFLETNYSRATLRLSISSQENNIENKEFNPEKLIAEVQQKYNITHQQYLEVIKDNKALTQEISMLRADIDTCKKNDVCYLHRIEK